MYQLNELFGMTKWFDKFKIFSLTEQHINGKYIFCEYFKRDLASTKISTRKLEKTIKKSGRERVNAWNTLQVIIN